MSEFIAAAKISEIPPSGKLSVEIQDRYVVIVRVDDEYFCIDDVCTHDGGPLSEGELDDHCVICPRHGARFDIRTGDALSMPATEPTARHEVRIDGETISIRLSA